MGTDSCSDVTRPSTSTNKELGDPQRGTWFCLEEAQILKGEWKLQRFVRQRHRGHEKCCLVPPCRTDSFSSPVTYHVLHTLPSAPSVNRGNSVPSAWNALPPDICKCHSLLSYRSLLSHHLLCEAIFERDPQGANTSIFVSIICMYVYLSAVGLLR